MIRIDPAGLVLGMNLKDECPGPGPVLVLETRKVHDISLVELSDKTNTNCLVIIS
jgi:hypothetical protein